MPYSASHPAVASIHPNPLAPWPSQPCMCARLQVWVYPSTQTWMCDGDTIPSALSAATTSSDAPTASKVSLVKKPVEPPTGWRTTGISVSSLWGQLDRSGNGRGQGRQTHGESRCRPRGDRRELCSKRTSKLRDIPKHTAHWNDNFLAKHAILISRLINGSKKENLPNP
jgi:hypothetical protein